MNLREGTYLFMSPTHRSLSCRIDSVNQRVGTAVSWLTLALVVLVTADVAMRYLFRVSFVACQEMEWHLFSIIFLLGSGYTLYQNTHVRVDVFYQRLNRRQRALINLLGCLFFLFPGCFLVIKSSWPFVHNAWAAGEGSPDPGGLPARYFLKGAIPVGFALLMLQGCSLLIQSLLTVTGQGPKYGELE